MARETDEAVHWSDPALGFSQEEDLVSVLEGRARSDGARAFAFRSYDEGGGVDRAIRFAELARGARRVAAALQRAGIVPGDPALLLYEPGPEFLTAFFGCLYANVLAVPVYAPDLERIAHTSRRIESIARNAGVSAGLTTARLRGLVDEIAARAPFPADIDWIATDALEPDLGDAWSDPGRHRHTPAFLQYTSGSTADPRGVLLTHDNLIQNSRAIFESFGHWKHPGRLHLASWLPMYHDMGLVGMVLQPLVTGASASFLSPLDFLERPVRWLELISEHAGDAVTSGGPNFAFALVVRRAGPDELEKLDLRGWRVAFCGAEPIRRETLERFAETLQPYGFRRSALLPCYGLAEATLMVTGGPGPGVRSRRLDAVALEQGRVLAASGDRPARDVVACGLPAIGHELRIVDPHTREPLAADRIGEVWVAGPSVSRGYWNAAEATERTFGARTAGSDRLEFLRTGDLGFVSEERLYVTGRIKDLIQIRGRNLYPQDLEEVADRSHPAVRSGCCAAFAWACDGEETVGLAVEVRLGAPGEAGAPGEDGEVGGILDAVTEAVFRAFGLAPGVLALLPPRSLPKTSSGKLQRGLVRRLLEQDRLVVLALRHRPKAT